MPHSFRKIQSIMVGRHGSRQGRTWCRGRRLVSTLMEPRVNRIWVGYKALWEVSAS